jgi:hypothetical protein
VSKGIPSTNCHGEVSGADEKRSCHLTNYNSGHLHTVKKKEKPALFQERGYMDQHGSQTELSFNV